jgi:pilus assembly protein CpaE
MGNKISCLIVDPDQEAIRLIDVQCQKVGTIELRWKAGSMTSAFEIIRKHMPEMAIVDLDSDTGTAIESISAMARDFPFLYLLGLSEKNDSGLILKAMRAGAHDFLCKPVNENDLRAAAEKVFKLKSARKELLEGGGKIVSVFSNKGGNGTTTIAVNLADALVRYDKKKVVVVDLALASGDVTTFFNVNPAYSILDLAKNAEKADYDFLHTLLLKHSSGVYILADPPMIEDADSISAGQVKVILATLRSMFDIIIVDTSHHFEQRTLTALEASDVILLVTLLNLPSLKNTKKCIELFGRIGFRAENVRIVLSRYLPSDEIPKEKIEELMKRPVFFAVPNDYPTVISSVNRGKLLREIAPDKEVTKSFRQMASLLLQGGDRQPVTVETTPKRKFMNKIFGSERSSK